FACPALFLWHTAKNVTRAPTSVAADFNARVYATLVAHSSPFWKFPKEFLCLVGLSRHYTLDEETYPRFLHKNGEEMDLFAFIHTPDATKVKVVERKRVKDEPPLLQTTVGRTVHLLPTAPDRADSELETSIDKVFDERGSGSQVGQGGSAGIGEWTNVQLVIEATGIVTEDVAPLQPRHGKSSSAVQSLLAGAVLNAQVRGSVPVMTAVIITTSTTDLAMVVKEKTTKPSLFAADSYSAGGTDPNAGVFSDLTGSDFLVSGVHIVIDPDIDIQKGMKHDQLFTEFNVGAARQMSLSAEVRMRAKYNIKEKKRLKSAVQVADLEALAVIKEREMTDLSAQLTFVKSHNDSLIDQDAQLKVVNDKLYADFVEMAFHLDERAAIGKAIEKGMQDGLYAEITHGAKGRVLTDVAAYNPSAEAD
nr:hypothetical protein [Tanacetum cinerariifolium]